MPSLYERIQILQFGWRDALDIVLVGFVIYNLLVLIRGTRAMQMAIGLSILAASYFVARLLDLTAFEALAREILFYLPFAIIVLFQQEIRRALAQFGKNPLVRLFRQEEHVWQFEPIIGASTELAERRIGALIVVERSQSLRPWTESGKTIDAVLSPELLLNIFTPRTPLHDGAVIVERNRILAAGVFLPLSSSTEITAAHGTRHRAAVGLTEETDAFVIVISEENGSISVALEGKLYEHLLPPQLQSMLETHVAMRHGTLSSATLP